MLHRLSVHNCVARDFSAALLKSPPGEPTILNSATRQKYKTGQGEKAIA